MKLMITVLAVWVLTAATLVTAAEPEHAVDAHGGGHHAHKHHVAAFFGNTHDHHGEDAFTVGLDYEFRLNNLLAIGALIDHATGDIDSTVAGAALFIHPWRDLRLLAAGANEHRHSEDEFIVRVGAAYDIAVSGWTVSPIVQADLLLDGEENWVYGFGVGRGF